MVQILERPKSERERFMESFTQAAPQIGNIFGGIQKSRRLEELAKKFESRDPGNKQNQAFADIIRSGLAEKEQTELIKALKGSDPFKQQQQERLALDSVLNRYSKRIKEIDESLKQGMYKTLEDKSILEQQRSKLQAERDELLGFKSITGEEDDLTEEKPSKKSKRKTKFNPKNIEHKAKAQQLFSKFGDKEKVREALAKEFDF
jgi:hypothetical protein